MNITELFNGLKKKKYRTGFALYSPENDGMPAEVQKWYLNFTCPSDVIVAVWRESGIVTVEHTSIDDYIDSWSEYVLQCSEARSNSYEWSMKRSLAVKNLSEAKNKNASRFWTSVIGALDFCQVDTRML